MVLVPSPRQTSCFLAGSYRSMSSVPTGMVDVWPVTVALLNPPQPPPHPQGPPPSPNADKIRTLVDPGQAFLRELFVHSPLNGLVDQLIRHRPARAREVDPLVSFVGSKVRAVVVVVVNILCIERSHAKDEHGQE